MGFSLFTNSMRVLLVNKTKTKNFADSTKKNFVDFLNFKPSLGSREIPQKNVGQIGSVVLTILGCKQTDRQAKFID